ncbi:hypothetical protein Hanom_Chr16g01422841 [Helianthus anomalus]
MGGVGDGDNCSSTPLLNLPLCCRTLKLPCRTGFGINRELSIFSRDCALNFAYLLALESCSTSGL